MPAVLCQALCTSVHMATWYQRLLFVYVVFPFSSYYFSTHTRYILCLCSLYVSLADLSRVDRDFPDGPLLENTELLFLTALRKGDETRHLFLHVDGVDLNNRLISLEADKEALQVFVAKRKQLVEEKRKVSDDIIRLIWFVSDTIG